MRKKNLCPKTLNLGSPEKIVAERGKYHYDDGDCRAICGSISKSLSETEGNVTCMRCKSILDRRKNINKLIRVSTDIYKGYYCSICGAFHHYPPFIVRVGDNEYNFSLCGYCRDEIYKIIKNKM